MSRVVGIDLGTTNSVVAYLEGGRVETITNPEGAKTTPSVVLFGEEVVVGEFAKRQAATHPGLVVRSAKRLMGRRYSEIAEDIEDFPYEVAEKDDDRAEIRLSDGRVIPPELVAAQVLQKMCDTAEQFIGDDVISAVITVPAHFNDAQRTATKHAAELIDLEVIRIINEPTAAALAYGFGKERAAGRIAVFDFGGGTFDISILQLQGDIFEVLSTNGNTLLGGDNIDLKIFNEICDGILQSTGIDPTRDLKSVARIYEAAEKAKIELSSLEKTHISLPFIVADSSGPKHYESDITRASFNEWMGAIFESLFVPCADALRDANLTVKEIDEVILVGGSTRIPKVREMVEKFFGRKPDMSVNPDEAVAIGAAIQAGVIKGELQEILLLDITPLSLGVELAGGVFKPLIDRNSSIPCEATRKFTTVVDNQSAVMVHVLQGERAKAAENRTLARFRLAGIPAMPKELPEIEVTFRIDANGILEVSAVDLTSGVSAEVQVEGYGEVAPLSATDINKLLEDVAAHQKEDLEFVRQAHRRSQAERTHQKLNLILDAIGDQVEEADLRRIKETMLRHDLAVSGNDWMMVEMHETILQEMIEKYEDMADLQVPSTMEMRAPRTPDAYELEFERLPREDMDGMDIPTAVESAPVEEPAKKSSSPWNPRPSRAAEPTPPPDEPEKENPRDEPQPPPAKAPKIRRIGEGNLIKDVEDIDFASLPPPPPPD